MSASVENKELILINNYIDSANNRNMANAVKKPLTKEIFEIIKKYIEQNNVCVYGGTAVNNILPKGSQFYDKDIDLPDYDFFSPNAMDVAKEVADLFFDKGYVSVEAKSSVYKNTYKIFVNYIPVADITRMDKSLFDELMQQSIVIKKINYAPANFLRMLLYLELSRPHGYVGRWTKLVTRLNLLNHHYPIKINKCKAYKSQQSISLNNEEEIFEIVKKILISNNAIFIGGFAGALYSKYLPKSKHEKVMPYLDFDVIHKQPHKLISEIKHKLVDYSHITVAVVKHDMVDVILSTNYDVTINGKKILGIFKPMACHAYNNIRVNNKMVRVGSIETLFNFYLAFLYAKHSSSNRIICFCNNLFKIRKTHRTAKKGLVNRFSLKCYGKQTTVQDMIEEKSKMYNKLQSKKNNEYNKWFLKYIPANNRCTVRKSAKKTKKSAKKTNKSTKKTKKSTKKAKKTNKSTKKTKKTKKSAKKAKKSAKKSTKKSAKRK